MYKNIISKYIPLLTVDHVKNYALNNNIDLNNHEAKIVYDFIKDNYEKLSDGNLDNLLPLKNHLSTNTYNNLIILYKNMCIKLL